MDDDPDALAQDLLHAVMYLPGNLVELQGLVVNPTFNGRLGHLVAFDANRGRWDVKLVGDHEELTVCVPHANLLPMRVLVSYGSFTFHHTYALMR